MEKEYIPRETNDFMYVRPTYISMTDQLGVLPAINAKIFIILSTIQANKTKPLKLLCTESITKKYPESFGHLNLGSNLGPVLEELKLARENGYDDILFLINDNITELCDMNVFVYWENQNGTKELLTPALDGTVLPGVTRDSVLKISKESGVDVTERHISIREIINAISDKKTVEMFATSTMSGINPIQEISYEDRNYKLPGEFGTDKKTPFTRMIHENLQRIKTNEESHPWITVVE
jgi:branched-chain amino acid aminotransferase